MNSIINKNRVLISVTLMVILGFAAYGNSLKGKFIWDDEYLIRDNPYIRTWSCLPKLFTEDIGTGPVVGHFLYRPLQMVTYMADYSLWRLDVRGYHFTNILLHILTALAIYWLVNILYDDRTLSLFTSVLFITHPIHVEAVTYISGRADSLALLFMLISFIFYIKCINTGNPVFCAFALLSYVAALLSRESSLILPALLLLYHYTFRKRPSFKCFLSVFGIALVYILFRLTVLKYLLPHLPGYSSLFERLPGFFVAITNYIRLMLLPVNLHMEYGNRFFDFSDPKAIAGVLILFSLLGYAFRKRNSNRLLFFSVYWFFVTLLPVSCIYPFPMAYMAEHWLYVPSIGFFLLVAYGLRRLYGIKVFKVPVIVFMISLAAFYSFLTHRYNEYWREPIKFYERTLRHVPDSIRTLGTLANRYRDMGKHDEAVALYEKLIKLNPNSAKAYNNLGVTYSVQGKYRESITPFKKALEIDPFYAKAYNNLGSAYKGLGEYREAVAAFKKAVEIDPFYAKAYNNLGSAYGYLKEYDEAITAFKEALNIEPNYPVVHNNLALAYYKKEQYHLAIEHCDMAVNLGYEVHPELLKLLEQYRK
ncbi:MAG: hypothetical protein A2Z72_04135 [Omnitrophica bacterium RBG_13_46_9]|nr:MAG: hypothetical protein A2Z72_04135 [Omnitrophica bacterium RBG_13_46_9]